MIVGFGSSLRKPSAWPTSWASTSGTAMSTPTTMGKFDPGAIVDAPPWAVVVMVPPTL
jgi:hypothetical protein